MVQDFASGICFCNFVGGRLRVLSKFPLKSPQKSDLNWVHGFHRVCVFLGGFAYEITFVHFWRREAQGT